MQLIEHNINLETKYLIQKLKVAIKYFWKIMYYISIYIGKF